MSIEPARQFATVHEIVKAARKNLAQGVWDYVVGGTDTETTCAATAKRWTQSPSGPG